MNDFRTNVEDYSIDDIKILIQYWEGERDRIEKDGDIREYEEYIRQLKDILFIKERQNAHVIEEDISGGGYCPVCNYYMYYNTEKKYYCPQCGAPVRWIHKN